MSKMSNLTFLSIIVAFVAIVTLSACATIDGAGQDIESVGEKIQE